jgi:hypothetical protein
MKQKIRIATIGTEHEYITENTSFVPRIEEYVCIPADRINTYIVKEIVYDYYEDGSCTANIYVRSL